MVNAYLDTLYMYRCLHVLVDVFIDLHTSSTMLKPYSETCPCRPLRSRSGNSSMMSTGRSNMAGQGRDPGGSTVDPR